METIATFSSPVEAHLLRMRLEEAGFSAFVLDDSVIQLNPFYSNANGGVRVQVNGEDAVAVREYLATEP